ncbi:MAG: YceI family protein [Acidobacteria bacterium]|nr:YceI family protein [Acidobacteriota bacterium]
MTRRRKVIATAAAALAIMVLGGPALYAALNRAPARLDDRPLGDGTAIRAADLNGAWTATDGSIVGYRVEEQIALAKTESVGRTSDVSGRFTVEGGTLVAAEFEVQLATLASDRSQRDQQVRTRILDVAAHPVATFVLAGPVPIPDATDTATMEPFVASGDLTIRGTTKRVDAPILASLDDGRLRLTGSIEIVFSEWGIPNPSIPAALIFTKDRGTLEFDLLFHPTD